MHRSTLLCAVMFSIATAVDVMLYKASSCATTAGQDETCTSVAASTCCNADDLGQPEYFKSAKSTDSTKELIGFANQNETRCAANLGSSSGCFDDDDGIIAGAYWRDFTRRLAVEYRDQDVGALGLTTCREQSWLPTRNQPRTLRLPPTRLLQSRILPVSEV